MYKKILVAVDGSETSNLAVQEAIKLAISWSATLHMVHVVGEYMIDWPDAQHDMTLFQAVMKKAGQEILHQNVTLVKQADIEVKEHLLEINGAATVAETVLHFADTAKMDLIIVGTEGRRGFRRLMLGSVAEEIIRGANHPVLLVRGGK